MSVDVPSGWDVDKGNVNCVFTPEMLVSITFPKLCAKDYLGIHYIGGRFMPKKLIQKHNLLIPPFQGSNMILRLN